MQLLKLFRLSIYVLVLIFLQVNMYGQERTVMHPSKVDFRQLSEGQKRNFNLLSKKSIVRGVEIFELNSLAASHQDGKLTVYLPNSECKNIVFNPVSVEYENENDYTWYGEIMKSEEESCSEGNLLLTSSKSGKSGHLSVQGELYEIVELGRGLFGLVRYNEEEVNKYKCQAPKTVTGGGPIGGGTTTADGTCEVDVLVLYTQAAKNSVSNINTLINLARSQTNLSLANSNTNGLKINVVAKKQHNFTESTNIFNDVSDIAASSSIANLRDQYGADLVVMMTDGNYGPFGGVVDDIGPSSADAFCIVQTDYATSTYTFAHEIGHLFGCRHNTDPNHPFAHGHNFTKGFLFWKKRYKTILNTLGTPRGGSRIPHFSNPNVKYSGKKTGTSKRDNARMLRNTGCTVASFKSPPSGPSEPEPLVLQMIGPTRGCPCDLVHLTVNPSGGTPPYQYSWSASTNGFNYYPIGGNMPSVNITLPCETLGGVFVKVTVTSSDGQVKTRYRGIVVSEFSGFLCME